MSEYRVEKRREPAQLTLVTGVTLSGVFFLAGSSQVHTGPERIGDVLNLEPGFFPFECDGETSLINRAHVLKVALPAQMIEAELDAGLDRIWTTMRDCIAHGLVTEGQLPGGLNVKRRAARRSWR